MNPFKKRLNFLLKIIYIIAIVLIVLVGAGVASSVFNLPLGIKLFVVQSGSMEPNISVGSLIFVKHQENYLLNDVITFKSESEKDNSAPQYTTTHRVTQAQSENGEALFTTKGDANNAADSLQVKKELIIGKVLFSIPLVGYLISYAKTSSGFIFLIIIPAVLLVYTEILNIKKEIINLFQERGKKLLLKKDTDGEIKKM